MKFEWHEGKNETNLKKHGLSFEEAVKMFNNPTLEFIDENRHSEERIIAIGQVNLIVLVVVYTIRNGVYRIISARKAEKHEKKGYYHYLQRFR